MDEIENKAGERLSTGDMQLSKEVLIQYLIIGDLRVAAADGPRCQDAIGARIR